MKIRTRLLLFLFPTLVLGIILLFMLFTYTWYEASEKLVHLVEDSSQIDHIFKESLLPIALSAIAVIIISWISLFTIANKISRPIQQLNNGALALAAGQYGQSIAEEGPKEIVELAGTLNIMSECLLEHINRLKENAWLRERMYGEYECAMLLQHLMLQKNIDECKFDALAMQAITFFSSTPRGLLLKFSKIPHAFQIQLTEAKEAGLEGMYGLVTQNNENDRQTTVHFDPRNLSLQTHGKTPLLLWSIQQKRWKKKGEEAVAGDLFFLCNEALIKMYHGQERVEQLLAKVLKVFAQDGFKIAVEMLQKEISLSLKRKDLEEDVHILCFQILYKNSKEEYSKEQIYPRSQVCPL